MGNQKTLQENEEFDSLKDEQEKKEEKKKVELASLTSLFKFLTFWEIIQLFIMCIFSAIQGSAMPFFSLIFSTLLDSFSPTNSSTDTMNSIKKVSMYFIIIAAVNWILCYIFFTLSIKLSEKIGFNFRYRYLEAILKQETAWFDSNNFQELPTKISSETEAIQKATGETFSMTINAIFAGVAGFVIAFIIGWKLAFILLGLFPIILCAVLALIKSMQNGFKDQAAAYSRSGAYAEQALNSIKVVSAFGQEETEKNNYIASLEISTKNKAITAMKQASGLALFNTLLLCSYAYGLSLGGVLVYERIYNEASHRDYTAGDTIGTFFGVIIGIFSLGRSAPNMKTITNGRLNAKVTFDLINRLPQIPVDDLAAEKIQSVNSSIEFRNVSFAYSGKHEKAIKNINFVIEKGKMTAFVGPSGSGKSTIVKLVERFYDPSEGEVLVNGRDLKEINLRSYRQRVGYVGQEPVLFNQTIRENMLYCKPDATQQEIETALKKGNAYNFVMEKDILDKSVGNAGSQISGGQKQRVALSRAFLKNPDVLILDEATSALDRKNEILVQQAIDAIRIDNSSLTTIVIAHRLSTIRDADKIIVMKKGEIVEVGDHDTLLEEYPNGVYAELVKKQQLTDEDSKDDENDSDENEEVTQKANNSTSLTKRVSKMYAEDKEELERTNKANENYELHETELKDKVKENASRGVFKRLFSFNRPMYFVFIGLICSLISGAIMPVFAIFFTKILFIMMSTNKDETKTGVGKYAGLIMMVACIAFVTITLQRFSFGMLSQNMVKKLRTELYINILRKHLGWFDNHDNSPGQITSVLSGDIQTVNGASTESLAAMFESFLELILGIILALIFEWRISLVTLGCVPLIVVASFIQTKVKIGASETHESNLKDANSLVSDAILNNLTVASFGYEYLLVDKYKIFLTSPMNDAVKKAHIGGIAYGFSQFAMFAVYSFLFYIAAIFVDKYSVNSEDLFLAIFIIMFSSYGSGQAQQFAPSAGKGKRAANRIFSIIDEESELDPFVKNEGQIETSNDNFRGDIEFRDVWFRYPTRRDVWVLRGLSFKISKDQAVGLAGESGCGKSTVIQLLYRFYDPQFGNIFIDGIDIKDYNIHSLRKQFGLVQQEPILFNYSVRDNILYSKMDATYQEIVESTKIANAIEFVDQLEPPKENEDKAMSLFNKEQKDDENLLPPGYYAECGIKGGKLSGGQKQRIAIARAIVRKPHVLMLDEATSALDEDSQNKVQVALDRIMGDRTTIVIAHRLTTIQKCNKIIVIKHGKLEEEGTFQELMKKKGYFAKISGDLSE